MKNLYRALILAFFGIVMTQCITDFDPQINENVPKLVVDGLITNQPGPYRVTLQYSYPYVNKTGVRNVAGATIEIKDDRGTTEKLIDRGNGVYETAANGIRGVVGRKYNLTIKTPDGKSFVSKPELLRPVATAGKVYYEYQALNNSVARGQFNVFIDVKDPDTADDFYRWKWTHYEPIEYCLLTVTTSASGAIIRQRNKCCEPCWKIQPCNGCIIMASDRLVNGKTITRNQLGRVLYDDTEAYYMLIEQQSLTSEAYQYWRMIDSQINNSGGIFDLPPATVNGNISSTSNPDEQVLGYFGASSVVYIPTWIQRNNLGGNPPYSGQPANWIDLSQCQTCKESPFRTPKKPLGL